jgi:hypothetical protein
MNIAPRRNRSNDLTNRKRSRRHLRSAFLLPFLIAVCLVSVVAGGVIFTGRAFKAKAAPQQEQVSNVAQQLSASAAQQIQALLDEKENRTPAQQKIDSQLLYAAKMASGQPITANVQTLAVNVSQNSEGRVEVDITAVVDDSLIKSLEAGGAKIIASVPEFNSIRAEVSLANLEQLAALPKVVFIQPKQEYNVSDSGRTPSRGGFAARAARVRSNLAKALKVSPEDDVPIGSGAMTNVVNRSEGDVAHRADAARGTFNTNGSGVKIGVLSNGVVSMAQAQATGDLPSDITVLAGQTGAGDEGTAMLEIVYDVAPGAKLYFATANTSIASFAQNIRNLRAAGCDIIVDDVFYFVETPFQDGQGPGVLSTTNGGIVAQAVNDVTANGALYFSSAGNSGNKNDGTSGTWEGDFTDGGVSAIPGLTAGTVHDFDTTTAGTQFDQVTVAGSPIYSLYWSDPLGGSTNDYDFFAVNSAGTAVTASSTNLQTGTQDPYEPITASAAGSRLVVVKKATAVARFLHITTNRGRLAISTAGTTQGHANGPDSYCVAATPAAGAFGGPPNPTGPFPGVYNSSNAVELFSSDGPRRLFFNGNGAAFTPTDFSSTGGVNRQKPDLTAADGVSVTGVGGFGSPFYGTSAAAPHAAAIAGLIKSARPDFTPAQIRTALTSSAIDIETPGVDRNAGAGIVMAYQSLQAAGVTGTANLRVGSVTVAEVGGNGNGSVEPGEEGTLSVQLTNTGVNDATGITATLTTDTPGVTVRVPGTSTYPNIVAMTGVAVNDTLFRFVVDSGAPCPATVHFILTISYTGGPSPKALDFTVSVSQTTNISTTLDAIPPANGPNFTATTGNNQVGRLVRTGTPSACGIVKANPLLNDLAVRRYDAYSFPNNSPFPICVTVTLTTSVANAANIQSVSYGPIYDPANPSDNYLGDIAGNGPASRSYSFTVPASTNFVVVVSELSPASPAIPYTLRVDGLPCSAAPANQPPVNVVPAVQTTNEDTSLVFSAANGNQISVSDPEAGNDPIQVSLSAVNGALTLNGTAGLTFSVGNGFANTAMTFTGSITNINNALNGSSFNPMSNFNGSASLSITTNDKGFTGSGGAKTDTDTIAINVNPVNDAPVITVPGPQSTVENTPLTFAVGFNNRISLDDVDAGNSPLKMTISVTNGTFSLNGNNGLTFTTGDGVDDPAMVFTGTLTWINSAIHGLTFKPAQGFSGAAGLSITADDQGNTGSGGALTDNKNIAITVADGGTLQFSAPTFSVNEDGGNATITVTRSGGSAGTATINYATSNGTATAGPDYAATSGTLTFASGETTKTFTVPVTNDSIDEPDETVNLTLSSPGGSGAVGTPSSAVLTIVDTTPAPTLSINDVSVIEGNSGVSSATFTVTLSAASGNTVTASYATADQTALAGSDYLAASGTVTFSPGEVTKTIAVTVNGDTINENNETFLVNLSSPVNATFIKAQGVGTITNDDTSTVQFSASNFNANESGGNVTITVTRTGSLTAASVDYATSEAGATSTCDVNTGFASSTCDYITARGTLDFAVGEASKTITILLNNDLYVEGPETFNLTISNARGGQLGSPSTATVTIVDNDTTAPTTNPLDDARFFVREQYHQFLNREPDQGGLDFWTNEITKCGSDAKCVSQRRIDVSAAFFIESEFQQTGFFVHRMYKASLGVRPTYLQFVADRGELHPGPTLEPDKTFLLADFVQRSSFVTKYASAQAGSAFVDAILQTVQTSSNLNLSSKRPELIAEYANGTDQVDSRSRVVRKIVDYPEYQKAETNPAFVLMQYFGYLTREPDQGGLDFWLNVLNSTNPSNFRGMVCAFINSAEYQKKYSGVVTRNDSVCK